MLRGASGRMKRVTRLAVFDGSETLTISMALNRVVTPVIAPAVTSTPDPLAARAPLAMVGSSMPLMSTSADGFDTSTVAKPCDRVSPMPT